MRERSREANLSLLYKINIELALLLTFEIKYLTVFSKNAMFEITYF